MKNLFILTNDYKNFKKGSIMQKGSDITEDGIEFFDVSTEMETGECYSDYNIPEEYLTEASQEVYQMVNSHPRFIF